MIAYDSSFAPPQFRGINTDDADEWLSCFEKYILYRALANCEKPELLRRVLLRDDAADWYDAVPLATKADWQMLKEAFKQRESDLLHWQKATELWNRSQGDGERVDVYVTAITRWRRRWELQETCSTMPFSVGHSPTATEH